MHCREVRTRTRLLMAGFFLCGSIFLPWNLPAWIAERFGPNVKIEQVLFHLCVPLEGVYGNFYGSLLPVIFGMFLWTLVFYLYLCGFFAAALNFLSPTRKIGSRFFSMRPNAAWGIILLFFCISTVTAFSRYDIWSAVRYYFDYSSWLERQYRLPGKDALHFPGRRRNVVMVIVESAESGSYVNSYEPELEMLRKRGRVSARGTEVRGAQWTFSSMASMYYGVPIFPLWGKDMAQMLGKNPFPGSPSLWSIFNRFGYRCVFFYGFHIGFAGTGKFFAHLPRVQKVAFDEQRDAPEFISLANKPEWGIPDEFLFYRARQELTSAAKDTSTPFFFSIKTSDTHPPNGFVMPGRVREFGDLRDVIREQSRLVGDFVAWIESQPFAANTAIVICGDHLAMTKDIPFDAPRQIRRIYGCVINPDVAQGASKADRVYAAFDWCPTILHAAGARWDHNQFGLGTSLLSGDPTLLERVGAEFFESETLKYSPFYQKLLRK